MLFTRHIQCALAALAVSATAGCVGEFSLEPAAATPPTTSGGGGEGGDAKALFDSTVQPIMGSCTGGACHDGAGTSPLKFLGASGTDDDYASIKGRQTVTGGFNPAQANLLLKIDGGNHYGTSYTPAQRQAIVEWLNAERLAIGGSEDPGDVQVTGNALAVFWNCATINDWNQSDMGDWSDKGSNDGPCQACHNDGLARFNTNANNQQMFDKNKEDPLFHISFFTVEVDTTGAERVIPAWDKLVRMGNGTTLHPTYNYGPNNRNFQDLAQFHSLVMAKVEAGNCPTGEQPL